MTAGEVEHAMRCDRLLDRCSVIVDPVPFHPDRVHVDPFAAGRQGADGRWKCCGHGSERSSFILHSDCPHPAFAGNDEAIIEVFDLVQRALGGNGLAAFAEFCEGRRIIEDRVLESDFGERILFQTDNDHRTGDVLEPRVLDP